MTANENRTFKIWNIETFSLHYQSNIISSSPIVTLYCIPSNETFVCGTYDGTASLFCYIISYEVICIRDSDNVIHHFEIAEIFCKFLQVRTYSYADTSKCRMVHQFGIAKLIKSFRSSQTHSEKVSNSDKRSRGTWQQDYGSVAGAGATSDSEVVAAVLSVNCLSVGRPQYTPAAVPSTQHSQRLQYVRLYYN